MENIELVENMAAYNRAQKMKMEIAKKKHELEIAEATLKTRERSAESFLNVAGSMREDRDGVRGSGRAIERLKSEIENLSGELKMEEEKLQEKIAGRSVTKEEEFAKI